MYMKLTLTTIGAALMLVGCGGGGDSSANSSTQNPQDNQAPASSSLVTSVSPATYPAATAQRYAYDYLNSQRQLCGFGLLQQSAAIDQAAHAHADYLRINNLSGGHYENQAQYPTGFTGVTPPDRLLTAGYSLASGAGSEGVGGAVVTYGSNYGQASVMDLFTAPYHGYVMLQGDREVGIGFTNIGDDPNTNRFVIDFAFTGQSLKQLMAGDQIATYPCNGTTGVLSQSYVSESPTPIIGRDIGTNPIGTPIYLKVRDGNTLVLTSYDLRKAGTSTSVSLQLLNKVNDTNNLIADNSGVILMPLAPLEKNATYQLTANGTNNGSAFNVSFTFSTGAF